MEEEALLPESSVPNKQREDGTCLWFTISPIIDGFDEFEDLEKQFFPVLFDLYSFRLFSFDSFSRLDCGPKSYENQDQNAIVSNSTGSKSQFCYRASEIQSR